MKKVLAVLAVAAVVVPTFATALDPIGSTLPVSRQGNIASNRAVLYDNMPPVGGSIFTSGSSPRTGGADEVIFDGTSALLTSMQFGFSIATTGPSTFDARIRIWDDIDFAATTTAQFSNKVADFTLTYSGTPGSAYTTTPVDLTPLPGGGVAVTANGATGYGANLVDLFFQVDFYTTGTTTHVPSNGVTYIFYNGVPTVGYTNDSPAAGGPGDGTGEVYWRNVANDGNIIGNDARSFTGSRANMTLHFEGTVVPEPASMLLLGLAGLLIRRR